MREVIVLAVGLPDEAMPGLVLDYRYDTGDPDLDATAAAPGSRSPAEIRADAFSRHLLLPVRATR